MTEHTLETKRTQRVQSYEAMALSESSNIQNSLKSFPISNLHDTIYCRSVWTSKYVDKLQLLLAPKPLVLIYCCNSLHYSVMTIHSIFTIRTTILKYHCILHQYTKLGTKTCSPNLKIIPEQKYIEVCSMYMYVYESSAIIDYMRLSENTI